MTREVGEVAARVVEGVAVVERGISRLKGTSDRSTGIYGSGECFVDFGLPRHAEMFLFVLQGTME